MFLCMFIAVTTPDVIPLFLSKKEMAGKTGFEPAHHGVKVRCLTTWLLPIDIF